LEIADLVSLLKNRLKEAKPNKINDEAFYEFFLHKELEDVYSLFPEEAKASLAMHFCAILLQNSLLVKFKKKRSFIYFIRLIDYDALVLNQMPRLSPPENLETKILNSGKFCNGKMGEAYKRLCLIPKKFCLNANSLLVILEEIGQVIRLCDDPAAKDSDFDQIGVLRFIFDTARPSIFLKGLKLSRLFFKSLLNCKAEDVEKECPQKDFTAPLLSRSFSLKMFLLTRNLCPF